MGVEKPRLYNLQILQTDIWGKNLQEKEKIKKHTCYSKIITRHVCQVKRKNTDSINSDKT